MDNSLKSKILFHLKKQKKGSGFRFKKIDDDVILAKNSIFNSNVSINPEEWQEISHIPESFCTTKSDKNKYFKNLAEDNLIMYLNRTLIDPSLSEKIEELEENANNQYSFLFNNNEEMQIDDKDFADPKMLMMRQKKILEKHKEKLKIDSLCPNPITQISSISQLAIILCKGGSFAIGIYSSSKCIFHKTDKKYVCRKAQGGRQVTKDQSKSISSIGSQIRRENEKILAQNILEILNDSATMLESCEIIALNAPGVNKFIVFEENSCLNSMIGKIRRICFSPKKANFTEVSQIYEEITKISFVLRT